MLTLPMLLHKLKSDIDFRAAGATETIYIPGQIKTKC